MGDFATIYALSCGEKLNLKSTLVEKRLDLAKGTTDPGVDCFDQ